LTAVSSVGPTLPHSVLCKVPVLGNEKYSEEFIEDCFGNLACEEKIITVSQFRSFASSRYFRYNLNGLVAYAVWKAFECVSQTIGHTNYVRHTIEMGTSFLVVVHFILPSIRNTRDMRERECTVPTAATDLLTIVIRIRLGPKQISLGIANLVDLDEELKHNCRCDLGPAGRL
jgi:hypothetical protein